MTNDQIETCDELWREALEAGLVRWQRGMVTRSGRIIAEADPTCVYTDAGVVRVSPADVRLDWSHPCNLGCLLAMAREATGNDCLSTIASCDRLMAVKWGVTAGGMSPYRPALESQWCQSEPEALLRAILATRSK